MSNALDGAVREEWLQAIVTVASARCREHDIQHPGDIADQLIIVAEVLAEYEVLRK